MHGHVLELLALTRALKKERTTRQLSDVEHVPRKEQPLTEDRREQVGVLPRAD